MSDKYKFQDLLGYPYSQHLPAHSKINPFLICSSRMGCDLCSGDFEIVREKDYPYFTLHILFDGCSFFHIDGHDYLLKKGDAFLIAAGEEHCYRNVQNSSLGLMWIELSGNGCRELLNSLRLNNIRTIDGLYTQKITAQLLKILSYVKYNSNPDPYELSSMQYALIMYLLKTASELPSRDISPVITAAMDFIQQNFTQNIQVSGLAKALHVSNTYLTASFRRYLGTSPYQYISMKRLEYACFLLETTELSCQIIAEKAGFYDSAHFHRCFTKAFRISPSRYQKGDR